MINSDIPDVSEVEQTEHLYRAFRAAPQVRMLPWAIENIVTDQGRPYDDAAYPHLGSPGGPMDSFDEPGCRTISLQFATRLGKTFFGTCAMLKTAASDPAPCMVASSTEKLAKEVTSRTYKMLHHRKNLDKMLLKSRRDQRQDHIEFIESEIFIAWSRSPTTLSDKNIKVGHAGELDKWEHPTTSKEPHPIKMFADRFKDYQSTRKAIYESTPTITGKSHIERLLHAGSNCRLYVPCPHCGAYQTLRMRDDDGTPRLCWDKPNGGRSDKDLARVSSHYVCESCEARIGDEHRSRMMRRGVWCPAGCTVDSVKAAEEITRREEMGDDGADLRSVWNGWNQAAWLVGTPERNGVDASYQLSSLYALSVGWGDVAAEFVSCKDKPAELRNFVMQWLGETWALVAQSQTWEQLGRKSIADTPQGVVPLGYSMITVGVDKQQEHYVFCVDAWHPDGSCRTIDYGTAETKEEVEAEVYLRVYEHEDGGPGVKMSCALEDSGYKPAGTYETARDLRKKGINVLPCKGSSTSLNAAYRKSKLGKETSMPGSPIVHVDTLTSQDWLEKQLGTLTKHTPGGWSLFYGTLLEHQDILEQLLNDAPVAKLDASNNTRVSFERLDTASPNDLRDCRRYAWIARLVRQRGAPIRSRRVQTPEEKRDAEKAREKTKAKQQPNRLDAFKRPGGWLGRR